MLTSELHDFRDRVRDAYPTLSQLENQGYSPCPSGGGRYTVACPFHEDSTPSFTIYPDGHWYCFGCQAHGDEFDLFARFSGGYHLPADFARLLSDMADHTGIPRPLDPDPAPLVKERAALANLDQYVKDCQKALAPEHRAYLLQRGVPEDLIPPFRLGFDPNPQSPLYGRLVFPVVVRGQVETVSGRLFGDTRPDGSPWPTEEATRKYKNYPNRPTWPFNAAALVAPGDVLLVEGPLDALVLTAAGYSASATLGTYFKRDWLPLLSPNTHTHYVCLYDPDRAGQEAAQRIAELVYQEGHSVAIALLPQGRDPDELVQEEGPQALQHLLQQAQEVSLPSAPTSAATEESPHLTDLGNSQRLARRHGQDLRYCHVWDKWMVWDGTRWEIDATEEITRRAEETVGSIYTEASQNENSTHRQTLGKWALQSEAETKIRAMVSLAKSKLGIPVRVQELDADPWRLCVANGTLELRTGTLRDPRREDLITKQAPVAYDSQALCPTWLDFLHRIMDGNRNLMDFLQRAIGYSLTGDTSEQCLFILHGVGCNGKSTFLETIRALLGEYATQTDASTLLMKRYESVPNDIARLQGARFVAAVEVSEGRRLAESLIKAMTGGEPLVARFLHQEFFEFKPQFKLFLATNHKPVIHGTDHAIWRRIRLIPFQVVIPPTEQDKHLLEKLLAELPGILFWALEGCLVWQRNGLGEPEEIKQATSGYRAEMDVLAAFIDECCVVLHTATSTAKDLYEAYTTWCEENGEKPETQRAFGVRLTERGFERDRGSRGIRLWRGIGLLAEGNQGDS